MIGRDILKKVMIKKTLSKNVLDTPQLRYLTISFVIRRDFLDIFFKSWASSPWDKSNDLNIYEKNIGFLQNFIHFIIIESWKEYTWHYILPDPISIFIFFIFSRKSLSWLPRYCLFSSFYIFHRFTICCIIEVNKSAWKAFNSVHWVEKFLSFFILFTEEIIYEKNKKDKKLLENFCSLNIFLLLAQFLCNLRDLIFTLSGQLAGSIKLLWIIDAYDFDNFRNIYLLMIWNWKKYFSTVISKGAELIK